MPVEGAKDAVVVLPGGGYSFCSDREAENVGAWLNGLGLSASILRYRVAPHRQPAPLEDALEAVRQTRAHDGVDRVGVIGFSAGGHLAGWTSCVGTGDARPDVALLCYPVVSLQPPYAHGGSRDNLLGKDAHEEPIKNLSLETMLHAEVPPMFLWHTTEDKPVPSQNSMLIAMKLADFNVPYELHIYERGKHGLGLLDDDDTAPREVASWMDHAAEFLRRRGFGS